MQLMSWLVSRLGSRFSLLFEPQQGRVMHSALGRFLDRPLDLAVGLQEPDGTERVMPFTRSGEPLERLEQFERFNSITFRGLSTRNDLRLELNVHSVFYPEDERLCLMPVFYLEIRLNPAGTAAGGVEHHPESVPVFLRIDRPETRVRADPDGHVDLCYANAMGRGAEAAVAERVTSLNAVDGASGRGLWLNLPVTPVGSGIKWRLVWGAHCADPVLRTPDGRNGAFRYTRWWPDLDAVMGEAIESRDERLLLSRRFERLIDQTSLDQAERHLIHQGFQTLSAATTWADLEDGDDWLATSDSAETAQPDPEVVYYTAPAFLALWPELLGRQLRRFPSHERAHEPSGGGALRAAEAGREGQPVSALEPTVQHLLAMQAYVHWTGDVASLAEQADLVERLARFLAWTDRAETGFPSQDGATPTRGVAPTATGLAVKRATGLYAAADLLGHMGRPERAAELEETAERSVPRIEAGAWVGDHYALAPGPGDPLAADPVAAAAGPADGRSSWDGYTIDLGDGMVLPALIGRPPLLDPQRLVADLVNAARETLRPYGCDQTSVDPDAIRISQNIARDLLARYVHAPLARFSLPDRYWELQLVDNTHDQSGGFVDGYLGHGHGFDPRGAASLGYLLARPRLVIDRLAPGGQRILVDPDRNTPGRWPLLPMADWEAGKVPICVVDQQGHVVIENEADPVIVRGEPQREVIG